MGPLQGAFGIVQDSFCHEVTTPQDRNYKGGGCYVPPVWLEEIGLMKIFGSTAEKMEEDGMKRTMENAYFLTQGV